jgi:hypothetical protein
MKTLAFGKAGRCILLVCGRHPIDDASWDKYLWFLKGELVPGTRPVALVYTEGAGPTVSQRQLVNELIVPVVGELKAAVLLSSNIARGIMTAMNWTNPVHRSFAHDELDAAMAFIEIEREDIPKVQKMLVELRDEIHRP